MSRGAPENDPFRLEVRDWLRANVPANWRAAVTGVAPNDFARFQREWFAKVVEGGYANAHWDSKWPGGGRSVGEQVVIFQEMARNDAPRLILHFVALYHTAMTLQEWGTEAQCARHFPAILKGEVWCQGFSEPNAGSDLASLRTSAVRKGDRYIVNGQKIWSTMSQHSDWCLLLVRTSSTGARQAGITYLLMDMRSGGIKIRPITQITGDEEFSEVFLDDVEIPVENRLGDEGEGWRVAQTTLASERGITILELTERMDRSMWRLAEALGPAGLADDQFRRAAVIVQIRIKALRSAIARFLMDSHSAAALGQSSLIKLLYADLLRSFTQLGLSAKGLEGQFWKPLTLGAGYETSNWMFDFMNSYIWTIAGGTNEIQRNIISERTLGMPREQRGL
jgi:alkylation response protein AidB-like acyl-CoA dehydrogenase